MAEIPTQIVTDAPFVDPETGKLTTFGLQWLNQLRRATKDHEDRIEELEP